MSPSARRVLEFVIGFIEANDWAPSMQEIKDGLGYGSKHSVHEHLHNLARDGYVELGGGPRMIRVTERGWREIEQAAAR